MVRHLALVTAALAGCCFQGAAGDEPAEATDAAPQPTVDSSQATDGSLPTVVATYIDEVAGNANGASASLTDVDLVTTRFTTPNPPDSLLVFAVSTKPFIRYTGISINATAVVEPVAFAAEQCGARGQSGSPCLLRAASRAEHPTSLLASTSTSNRPSSQSRDTPHPGRQRNDCGSPQSIEFRQRLR